MDLKAIQSSMAVGSENYAKVAEKVKEFLRFNGYTQTLRSIEREEEKVMVQGQQDGRDDGTATAIAAPVDNSKANLDTDQLRAQLLDAPKLYSFFESDSIAEGRQRRLTQQFNLLKMKHEAQLLSARAIFTISVNCLQHLHQLKEGHAKTDNLGDAIEAYKVDLGKYHKILLTELKHDEKQQLFSENVLQEHKNRIIRGKSEGNIENIIEVLLSLRVNALQISPELRRNLVAELIRNDVFLIHQNQNCRFLVDLLQMDSSGLKHAVCALISVIASTVQGVDYLLVNLGGANQPANAETGVGNDFTILQKIIEIIQRDVNCTDGSVTQRFCLAILQKMSVKEEVVEELHRQEFQLWLLSLLVRATKKSSAVAGARAEPSTAEGGSASEIHVFCLDFSSALLANILHSYQVLDSLERNPRMLADIMTRLLNLLKENIPTSVLIHLLICLSYLSKERFSQILEECAFVDRISDFVEWYSIKNPLNTASEQTSEELKQASAALGMGRNGQGNSSTQHTVVDKKTVLDLCAHMFHPKESSHDVSGTMEYNELKNEEKIKEFENVQGDLIFECFQDEVQ